MAFPFLFSEEMEVDEFYGRDSVWSRQVGRKGLRGTVKDFVKWNLLQVEESVEVENRVRNVDLETFFSKFERKDWKGLT